MGRIALCGHITAFFPRPEEPPENKTQRLFLMNLKGLIFRKEIVTNLSGGMKRKVNLGIALIGGSKVNFRNSFFFNFEINICLFIYYIIHIFEN
jgi:hypothetical protein